MKMNINMKKIVFFLLAQFVALGAFAQEAAIKEAEAAYTKEDYGKAIELYEVLTGNVILRFCNLSDEETTVSVSQPEVYTYDLLEKDQLQKEEKEIVLGKHEIRTIGWRA